jgi:hypothetical protein
MDLLMSVFITHKRFSGENRFDRLDILMSTLKSYSVIDWEKVHLYVELDNEFMHRKDEFTNYVLSLFGKEKVNLQLYRMTRQEQWCIFMREHYPIDTYDDNKLIWFTQCDDHMFIDVDKTILNEGIQLLQQDTSKFKTLYYSHWPEILRLSGKLGNQQRVGNYIKFNATLLDAIQIFNLRYLRYLLTIQDWRGREYIKIDNLIIQQTIWSNPQSPQNYGRDSIGSFESNLQTIYVPMRELVRHFDGYSHVFMRTDEGAEFPALKLPLESNVIKYSPTSLMRKVRVHHVSPWTEGNTFQIPDEWVDTVIHLYREAYAKERSNTL